VARAKGLTDKRGEKMKDKKKFSWCDLTVYLFLDSDVIATSTIFDDDDDDNAVNLPFVPFGANDEFLN